MGILDALLRTRTVKPIAVDPVEAFAAQVEAQPDLLLVEADIETQGEHVAVAALLAYGRKSGTVYRFTRFDTVMGAHDIEQAQAREAAYETIREQLADQ